MLSFDFFAKIPKGYENWVCLEIFLDDPFLRHVTPLPRAPLPQKVTFFS